MIRLTTSLFVAATLSGILVSRPAAVAPVDTVTTCEAANPFDTSPDDVALQACFDNYDWVLLKGNTRPGYVGYIISSTVKIVRDHALFTSADSPRMVTLLAAPDLNIPIFRVSAANDYEVSFIRFDGNRENRAVRDRPCDVTHRFGNVELSGNGFHVRYVESIGAVCGSAMTVGGSAGSVLGATGFEIVSSSFADNGRQPEEANGISGLWADGLTVFSCRNSTIRDNALWDNTDVDLGVNGGPGCSVYRNTITHGGKYAFAGLVAGDPSKSGGEFSHNVVTAGYNTLGFGIVVGCHPWGDCKGGYASDLNVHDNAAYGAVVNLAVDGLNGGIVENNVARFAQGNRVLNCNFSTDYSAAHFFSMRSLQPGYVLFTFDFGSSCR